MARNPVQFQKGLSLSDFNARYGREEAVPCGVDRDALA